MDEWIISLEENHMICLDYSNTDNCNNCESRNFGKRKDECRHMMGNGLCGKNPAATSSGECEAPCSYYEK